MAEVRCMSPALTGHPVSMEIIGILILVGVIAYVLITRRDKKRKV